MNNFEPFPLPINTNQTIGCCLMKNCLSNTISNANISWHSFPEDKDIREKWLEFIGVGNILSNSSTLCSYHFTDDCFEKDLVAELIDGEISTRLVEGSIPTIKEFQNESTLKSNQKRNHLTNNDVRFKNPKICCVPNCRANIYVQNDEYVKTFPFPRIKFRQHKWFKALDLKPQRLWHPHVCINHFDVKYLIRSSNNGKNINNDEIKLRSDAIPTLLLDNLKIHPYCKTSETHYVIPNLQENFKNINNLVTSRQHHTKSNKSQCKIYIPKSGDFCRICLAENIRFVPIAIYKECKSLSVDILPSGELFEKIIGIKIKDLPYWLHICFICYNRLETIYEFQKNAQKIHQNLKQIRKYPNIIENISNSIQKKYDRERKITNIQTNTQILIPECESDRDNLENSVNELYYDYESPDTDGEKEEQLNVEQTISEQETELNENYPEQEDIRKYFKCKLKTCNKIFLSKVNFNDHISRHHNIKSYNCKICQKWFYEMLEYQTHQKQFHSNGVDYKCLKCSKKFTSIYELSRHQKVHKPTEYCTICGKNVDNLRNHLKLHNVEKYFQCWICLKKFTSILNFKTHLNYVHTKRIFSCIYRKCRKKFERKTHLQKHMESHIKQENVYYCDICHERVYENVNKHNERHKIRDKSNDERYKCEICGDSFIKLNLFNNHIHNNHSSRKYKCGVPNCSLQFIRKAHFETHMRAHANPKNDKLIETLNNRFLMKLKMEKEFYGNTPHMSKNDQLSFDNNLIGIEGKNRIRKKLNDEFLWNSIDVDKDENLKILLNDDQNISNDCTQVISNYEEYKNYNESNLKYKIYNESNFKSCFEKSHSSVVTNGNSFERIHDYAEKEMEFENLDIY